jgi:hypothetical protein
MLSAASTSALSSTANYDVARVCVSVAQYAKKVASLSSLSSSGETGDAMLLRDKLNAQYEIDLALSGVVLGEAATKVMDNFSTSGEELLSFTVSCVDDFKCRRSQLGPKLVLFATYLSEACKADFRGQN